MLLLGIQRPRCPDPGIQQDTGIQRTTGIQVYSGLQYTADYSIPLSGQRLDEEKRVIFPGVAVGITSARLHIYQYRRSSCPAPASEADSLTPPRASWHRSNDL